MLGVQQDAVEYEVIEEPSRKFLGIGAGRGVKVRAWLKDDFVREIESARIDDGATFEAGDAAQPATGERITSDARRAPSQVPDDLSEEDLDRVADTATDALETVLSSFGIEAAIEEYEGDEGEIILDVVGSDLAILIGRHGHTLDSVQVLISAITHKKLGFRYPVLVDVEGYRNRRKGKLEEISLRAAAKATRQGFPVKLRPMTAMERRIVHMTLRDDAKIRTSSEGEDPFRAVVIHPNKR
ncbi:MAG: KH domain-containing protein [Clostridiales bacterium]|nr:KH domain-containing protein [Clostridiales bacterium]